MDKVYAKFLKNKKEKFHDLKCGDINYRVECKPGYKAELKEVG
jgi:hypothetical protein